MCYEVYIEINDHLQIPLILKVEHEEQKGRLKEEANIYQQFARHIEHPRLYGLLEGSGYTTILLEHYGRALEFFDELEQPLRCARLTLR